MKKRYKATIYIRQNNIEDRRVFFTAKFYFLWWAKLCLILETVDYAQLEAKGIISFEKEIVAI